MEYYIKFEVTALTKLLPPVAYQGGKQRLAREIVEVIRDNYKVTSETVYYDLCCGSGAVSLELISSGVSPEKVTMLDKSSWGLFWERIGKGTYDLGKLREYLEGVPYDISKIQAYLKQLSTGDAGVDEEYKYLLLQAGAFGGKQIYIENNAWKNTSFRAYWKPTETSSRRSPVNPMMPMPNTILERVQTLSRACMGVRGLHQDIELIIDEIAAQTDAVIYIDPPYKGTTKYGHGFDWEKRVQVLSARTSLPIFVSEYKQYAGRAHRLNFKSAKGGISGNRKESKQEWLNIFNT